MKKWMWMLMVGLWAAAVAAQADCPTIVQNALDAADDACEGIGRNQACYGNVNLVAVAQEGVPEFDFDTPGDIVDVAGVQSLELEPLDADSDIWGIALMRLQANLPDTLPGQNVTFLLFGDVAMTSGVEASAEPVLNPMQAFYFKTGVSDAPCAEAPDSGILIQTPEGAGEINFTVNEVEIQLGSTAYLQTLEDDEMAVNVVEHQAVVSAQGVTRLVPAGSRVRVPLDPDLAASGPPSQPEPYDNADLAPLPVNHLPRAVVVAPALTQAELDALAATALPVSGDWQYTTGAITEVGCGGGTDWSGVPIYSQVITLNGAFAIGYFGVWPSLELLGYENQEFTSPEPGLFVAEWEFEIVAMRLEVRVLSPTQLEGAVVMGDARGGPCATTFPFTMEAAASTAAPGAVAPSSPGG